MFDLADLLNSRSFMLYMTISFVTQAVILTVVNVALIHSGAMFGGSVLALAVAMFSVMQLTWLADKETVQPLR